MRVARDGDARRLISASRLRGVTLLISRHLSHFCFRHRKASCRRGVMLILTRAAQTITEFADRCRHAAAVVVHAAKATQRDVRQSNFRCFEMRVHEARRGVARKEFAVQSASCSAFLCSLHSTFSLRRRHILARHVRQAEHAPRRAAPRAQSSRKALLPAARPSSGYL